MPASTGRGDAARESMLPIIPRDGGPACVTAVSPVLSEGNPPVRARVRELSRRRSPEISPAASRPRPSWTVERIVRACLFKIIVERQCGRDEPPRLRRGPFRGMFFESRHVRPLRLRQSWVSVLRKARGRHEPRLAEILGDGAHAFAPRSCRTFHLAGGRRRPRLPPSFQLERTANP